MGNKRKLILVFILLFAFSKGYSQCSPDNTAPQFIPVPALVVSNDVGFCSATVSAAALSFPATFDACGVTSLLPNFPSAAEYVFPVGETVVIWTATDDAGNSASTNQLVTVIDDEAPQIVCPSNISINTNPGDCDAFVNVPLAVATDNCAVSSVTNSRTGTGLNVSGVYPVGVTTVTFEVTDSANITSVCSFDITVVNSQLPVITLIGANPESIEACAAFTDFGATAFDSCLGDISLDITTESNIVINAVGSYTITYNVTNSAGVAATPVIRTVNVVDTTAPSLTLIGPSTLNVGTCSVYTELGVTAIDPCFGDIASNVNTSYSSPIDTNNLGTYTVTYTVVDDHGNSGGSITRTVNIIDATAPDIILLGDNPQIIEACDGYTELGATAIDPCSLEDFTGTMAIDTSLIDPNNVGTYQVTYNVMDNDGNVAIEVVRDIEIIDSTAPIITLLGDNPQIVGACSPYVEFGATANDPCSGMVDSSAIIIDDSAININVEGTYQVTYNVCDSYGNCAATVTRDVEVVISNPVANAGNDVSNAICSDTTITLAANPVNGSNTSGLWTVTSGQVSGFSFSDATSPTSSFTGDVGETYTLQWFIDNPEPCTDVSDDIIVTFINCNALDFDGADDNITFGDNYNFNGDFSIELWMKSETQNNNVQTIFSKRESANLIDGYDIRVEDNIISFNWNNGESLVSPFEIITNRWHHIVVTNQNGTFSLFIDGILVNTTTGTIPSPNTVSCLVGAMDQTITAPFKPVNYFDGGIDELRIWDVALSKDQIRKMMNQEIENESGDVSGAMIPIDIAGLLWSDLNGYFRMNQISDLSSGSLVASNGSFVDGLLRNMTTLQEETAPIPYISISDGTWNNSSTWLYGSVQGIPNSMSIDGSTRIDWNIIQTGHNISSGDQNLTLLGLDVQSNQLTIENTDVLDGQSLRITDYLKLDGTIELVGESQLIQDSNSVVDYAGIGTLKRDQQGTSNLYNFNYWGSPVGINGINYQLETVLYDGSQPVAWINAHDANPSTSPITMSSRWLYTYENFPANSYADWQSINESSMISVGLGFIMKGSGSADSNQNYTFIGQPNNGTISTPITANYNALVGNPYPSALDSHEFLNDNSASIQGTIYYWEHYETNASHILTEYQGGYSTYNFSGGNPAVSPPGISGLGTPLNIPERYIPVAQGFFVEASTSGGQVAFENDQRVFVKESVTGAADNGSVFMRSANNDQPLPTDEDLIKRIRIHFKTPEGAIRSLLLAFTSNNEASEGFDYGYDAINTETFSNDMSWIINNESYVIQGVGDFEPVNMYPLGLFLSTSGTIEIGLDALENFEEDIDVYVYDALTDIAFQINDVNFNRLLENDDYIDRFYLTFQPTSSLSTNEYTDKQPSIMYLNNTEEIYIQLPNVMNAKSISLINTIGQEVNKWTTTEIERVDNVIRIKPRFISEGIYIVRLITTDNRITNKKIIIKYKD